MDSATSLKSILWLCSLVLTPLVLWRFWALGLARTYPCFMLLLGVGFTRSCILRFVDVGYRTYTEIFLISESILLILCMLATLEVFGSIFQRYPGIRSLARWITLGVLILSWLVAAISLYPELQSKARPEPLDLFFIAERGVLFGLTVLIILLSVFLHRYPLRVPRRAAVHTGLFALYFLSKSVALLVRNTSTTIFARESSSTAILAFSTLSLALWVLLVRRGDETEALASLRRWDERREQELAQQLRTINATLAGAGRK